MKNPNFIDPTTLSRELPAITEQLPAVRDGHSQSFAPQPIEGNRTDISIAHGRHATTYDGVPVIGVYAHRDSSRPTQYDSRDLPPPAATATKIYEQLAAVAPSENRMEGAYTARHAAPNAEVVSAGAPERVMSMREKDVVAALGRLVDTDSRLSTTGELILNDLHRNAPAVGSAAYERYMKTHLARLQDARFLLASAHR